MSHRLEWYDIRLVLRRQDHICGTWTERRVLKDVSGHVTSGQLLAIIGPSGCGKSSLLNVLSGRIPSSSNTELTGYILYNGEYLDQGMSSKAIAYVAQDETLFAFLTVKETLHLAAYFHSPMDTSNDMILHCVDVVLRELNLTTVADTILGNEQRRGVSGGEYKRVLIGKELIRNPTSIFLDEPTSGLDSYQAHSVMETMKALALNDRIVVAVIHQPRSSIFAMFDMLMILADGRLIYFGETNDSVRYFNDIGYCCPQHFNPADYFLDIVSINNKTSESEVQSQARIDILCKHFQVNLAQQGLIPPDNVRKDTIQSTQTIDKDVSSPSHNKSILIGWFNDFAILIWRANVNQYRNYGALVIRGVTSLFFAVLISLIYRDLTYNQRGIQNRSGLLYFVLINQGFGPLIGTLNTFPTEKLLVTREVMSGAYRFSSYYVARVVTEIPLQVIVAGTERTGCLVSGFKSIDPLIQ